jgi:hypothetical protein
MSTGRAFKRLPLIKSPLLLNPYRLKLRRHNPFPLRQGTEHLLHGGIATLHLLQQRGKGVTIRLGKSRQGIMGCQQQRGLFIGYIQNERRPGCVA